MQQEDKKSYGYSMLEKIIQWAKKEKTIKALILIGSRADEKIDPLADYDLSLFGHPKGDDWLTEFGKIWICIPEKISLKGKTIPTRLVIYEGGEKVDFTLFSPDSRPQFSGAFKVLIDKKDISSKLPAPIKAKLPSKKTFLKLIEEFWFECYHVAKYLKRKELWAADFRNSDIKHRLLLKMLEWYAESLGHSPRHNGIEMEKWLPHELWKKLPPSNLFEMMNLFRTISKETAIRLKFPYPQELDQNMSSFILKILN